MNIYSSFKDLFNMAFSLCLSLNLPGGINHSQECMVQLSLYCYHSAYDVIFNKVSIKFGDIDESTLLILYIGEVLVPDIIIKLEA